MGSANRIRSSLLVGVLVVVALLGYRAPAAVATDAGGVPASVVEIRVDDTPFHSDTFITAHQSPDEWVKFPVRAGMAYRVSLWWSADAGVSTYLCDGNAVEVLGYPGWVRDQPSTRWIRANADGFCYVHEWNPGGSSLGGAYTLSVLQKPFSEIASTVAGTVRNAPEGTSAAGASIGLWPADSWSSFPVATATAGADGTWSAKVVPGSYIVRFDDPSGLRTGEYFDHLTGVVGYPDTPTPVRVPQTTSIAGIDGTLALRGRVVGRIVTSTGGGVGGVTVTSGGAVYDGSAVTGLDGSFEIDRIDSGSPHELSVTRVEGWRIAGGETLTYRIAPGATFEPTLTLCPAGSIAGRVTNLVGDPLAGIHVVCLAPGGGAAISTVTGADGRYRLGDLSAGLGSLSFSDPGGTYATVTRGVAVSWGEEAVVDEALSASSIPSETVATFTIAPSAGSHGSIAPAMVRTVAAGANTTFTITPDTGYRVSGVLVDGSRVGAVTSYTFSGVSANHTISVTFATSLRALGLTIASDRTVSTHGHAVRFYGTTSRNVPNGTRLSFQIRKSVWARWTTLSVRSTYSGHHWSYTLSTWNRSHGTYYLRVRYTGAAYLPAVSAQKRLSIR
jgi:hypothetical protein